MKVLVTVKEAAAVVPDFEISGKEIENEFFEYELNEWDDYAIEEAVQLKEAGVAEEVITVTIGPERAEETIRMALAKGADEAIRIWDEILAHRSILDVETKTKLLTAVVEWIEPDLVFTGVQASDDNFGATGVALAKQLGMEWGSMVTDIEIDEEEQMAKIRRELEGGLEELDEVSLPAVFTIQTGINNPRYASLRGIQQAQSKPLETYDVQEMAIETADIAEKMRIQSMSQPEAQAETEYIEGEAEEQGSELNAILEEMEVVDT